MIAVPCGSICTGTFRTSMSFRDRASSVNGSEAEHQSGSNETRTSHTGFMPKGYCRAVLDFKPASVRFWKMWRLVASILLAAAVSHAAEAEFRGRVLCLPEEMNRIHKTDLPSPHEHIYGFRTEDGSYYTLLRTKLSEALFMDERLRKKDLLLKGTVLPKTQILDVTHIKSIRDRIVYDVYYYCDVCAIESVSPAECVCCRGPVQLIEKPVSNGQ